ncbi:MAG: hypothetical protein EOO36_21750, partial [Cytophagaceae bacterium]
ANEVVLGNYDELASSFTTVHKLNMGKVGSLEGRGLVPATVKVRYHHAGSPAFLEQVEDKINIYFPEPVHAITPGQAAVFYDGDDVLGGGWITRHVIGEAPAMREAAVSSAALA